MSSHEVVRVIRDIQRQRLFDVFDQDRAAFLARYNLTEDEQAAFLENDYKALYDLGCHPMAVLFFSQANKVPMAQYLRAIGAPPERVREFEKLMG